MIRMGPRNSGSSASVSQALSSDWVKRGPGIKDEGLARGLFSMMASSAAFNCLATYDMRA